MTIINDIRDLLGTIVTKSRAVLTSMRHAVANSWFYFSAKADFKNARADQSSIVIACVRWIQRAYSEAPLILNEWMPDQQSWRVVVNMVEGDILWLLNRPNPYYNGTTLMKAVIADRIFNGTGYIAKVRADAGNVVELWWLPAQCITPIGNDKTFIEYYEYRVPGTDMVELRFEDVIRLPDGMDPDNPKLGNAPVKCLLREVFTDDEAASMTSALMKNMGIPGVVISPKQGTIPREAGIAIKNDFMAKFTGEKRGEPLVMEGGVEIHSFGFSPDQMNMRELRGIPEERITAVIGVNAAVVGLGAGLATTKVGATLKEYREEAFESTVIPMYREMGDELTAQLLPDFMRTDRWRLVHDLRQVRVLQEDEHKRSQRIVGEVRGGMISIAEGRRDLGRPVLPEHEVYLRPRSLSVVPVGTSPEDQQAAASSVGNPVGRPPESLVDAQIRDLVGV